MKFSKQFSGNLIQTKSSRIWNFENLQRIEGMKKFAGEFKF